MASQTDLAASERAMQMICATTHGGRPLLEQLQRIDRIVDAWVFHPDRLTPDAMIEDLPPAQR